MLAQKTIYFMCLSSHVNPAQRFTFVCQPSAGHSAVRDHHRASRPDACGAHHGRQDVLLPQPAEGHDQAVQRWQPEVREGESHAQEGRRRTANRYLMPPIAKLLEGSDVQANLAVAPARMRC